MEPRAEVADSAKYPQRRQGEDGICRGGILVFCLWCPLPAGYANGLKAIPPTPSRLCKGTPLSPTAPYTATIRPTRTSHFLKLSDDSVDDHVEAIRDAVHALAKLPSDLQDFIHTNAHVLILGQDR